MTDEEWLGFENAKTEILSELTAAMAEGDDVGMDTAIYDISRLLWLHGLIHCN